MFSVYLTVSGGVCDIMLFLSVYLAAGGDVCGRTLLSNFSRIFFKHFLVCVCGCLRACVRARARTEEQGARRGWPEGPPFIVHRTSGASSPSPGQHDLIDPLRPVVQSSLLSAAVTHPWAMFPPLLNLGQIVSPPHRQTDRPRTYIL